MWIQASGDEAAAWRIQMIYSERPELWDYSKAREHFYNG
jgi:hypothetical protein